MPSLSHYGFVCGWHFGAAASKGWVSLGGNSCQGKCIHFTKSRYETLCTYTEEDDQNSGSHFAAILPFLGLLQSV